MQPLVSCILPTRNRSAYIKLALSSYLSQTYPNKELVIVDNGDDSTKELVPADPRIRYHHVCGKKTTGEMRNLCNGLAAGEIISHFDSDDWSAADRLDDQVRRLGVDGVLTGYSTLLFFDERDGKCYNWSRPGHPFLLGTSMCYRKSWWEGHPFAALTIGEDFRFFKTALREEKSRVSHTSGGKKMVALVHDSQTSRKALKSPAYQPVSKDAVPREFYDVQYR